MLDSIQEILDRCRAEDVPFWRVVRASDMEQRQVTAEASREKMRQTWLAMLESEESYQARRRSLSGLAGGDGGKMRDFAAQGHSLSGDYLSEVIAAALCVAAPTAGACGVLPAVQIPLYRKGKASEEKILQALYVAAGIGAVISCRACIAGAAGGCQAEIGSASAMAAGALVTLRGGSDQQIASACAMALKNLMGLVCDPVAGLVEVPCIKRNVIGAVNAVSCADMALAGIESRVPADQVIDCMGDVGSRIPVELRETALGGLAATPFGREVQQRMRASAAREEA